MIRVDPGSKMKEEEGLGVPGFVNIITIVKSRTNRAGQMMETVFTQDWGYDNILTNFLFLKSLKLVKGGGRSFYLEGLDSVKFSQKSFRDKLQTSPELQAHFEKLVKQNLEDFIFDPTGELQKAHNAQVSETTGIEFVVTEEDPNDNLDLNTDDYN